MKPLTYNAVLQLSPEDIAEVFPLGAVKMGQARWRPALDSEGADRTLKRLLRDKKKRTAQPRLLHRDSSRGYTHEPAMAMRPDAGEAPSDATVERWSEEVKVREASEEIQSSLAALEGEREGLRAQLDTYKRLAEERGVNIRSDLRVVERRLEELDRKLGVRRAA